MNANAIYKVLAPTAVSQSVLARMTAHLQNKGQNIIVEITFTQT
jgi:hypothetical protein